VDFAFESSALKLFISPMTDAQLTKAYAELPEKDQMLVASFIAADLMIKDAEFAAKLSRRHKQMDVCEQHTHAELLELSDKMEKEGR
jgi:hypothetical protein